MSLGSALSYRLTSWRLDLQRPRRTARPRRWTPAAAEIQSLEERVLLAATLTVGNSGGAQYSDLQTAINAANDGDTISVAAGTYTAHTTPADQTNAVFRINKALTIVSTGGAGQTLLNVPANQSSNLLITSSNVTVRGFTLTGGANGVFVDSLNGTPLTNVVIEDLIVNAEGAPNNAAPGGGHGVYLNNTSNSVIERVDVRQAYANGIYLFGGSNGNLVADSFVRNTVTQHAIAIQDANSNTVIRNTITGSAFHGIILLGASDNRIEENSISGHKYDGIILSRGTNTGRASVGNQLIENRIVSNGYATSRGDGTGIFLRSGSNNTLIFGNYVEGHVEAGISVWNSNSVLIEGNTVVRNGQAGIFITDEYRDPGVTPLDNSPQPGPTNDIVRNNFILDPFANAGVLIRYAANTEVSYNEIRRTNGANLTGVQLSNANGVKIFENLIANTQTGVYVDAGSRNVDIYRNRFFGAMENYSLAPAGSGINWDGGAALGGNFRTQSPNTTPYTNIIYDGSGSRGGPYADNFPFADERLGRSYSVTVFDLPGGVTVAPDSTKTIEYSALGAFAVDLYLQNAANGALTQIAADQPNTGIFKWDVPADLAAGTYRIYIDANDSSFNPVANGTSGAFTVTAPGLRLLTPGYAAQLDGNTATRVAWERAPGNSHPVRVLVKIGDGPFTELASNQTGDYVDVTVPNVSSDRVLIRVEDQVTGAGDTTDGYVGIRSVAGTFTAAPSSVPAGSSQRLTWIGTAGSATVDVAVLVGGDYVTLASQIRDTGDYTVLVPAGASPKFRLIFRDLGGNQVGAIVYSADNTVPTAPGVPVEWYRLYLADTKEHLFTSDQVEYSALGRQGWQQEGTIGRVYNGTGSVGGVTLVPLYRLYNHVSQQHLWTIDATEYAALSGSADWDAEGVKAFVLPTQVDGQSVPFYRLHHDTLPLHTWTTDLTEYNYLLTQHWVSDTPTGFLLTEAAPPVGTAVNWYRLYLPDTKEHLFTTDLTEYNFLGQNGWNQEGVIGRVINGTANVGGVDAVPLYRLYNNRTQQHLWTIDGLEYTTLRKSSDWDDEGIKAYVLPTQVSGSIPFYRLHNNALPLHTWTTDAVEYQYLQTQNWAADAVTGYLLTA